MGEANLFQSENYYPELESIYEELSRAGNSIRYVREYIVYNNRIYDIYIDKPLDEESFMNIYRKLVKENKMPIQMRIVDEIVLRIIPIKRRRNRLLQILLFILTTVTVGLTGFGLLQGFYELMYPGMSINYIMLWTILYTVLFLGTLAIHELGHLIVAKKFNVPASGPYFIPAPPIQLGFIGTLGAVISMEGIPPNKRSLVLLGISGPLLGFIAGTIVGLIGVVLSPLIPVSTAEQFVESGELSTIPYMPLMLILLTMVKYVPENYIMVLHPLAFISFIIFVVTFLNLMPIGQLDGGHIIRTYTSAKIHSLIGNLVIVVLILVGLSTLLTGYTGGTFYIVLSIILLFLKIILGSKPHPGAANQFSNLSLREKITYIVLYIILLILSMPIPVL